MSAIYDSSGNLILKSTGTAIQLGDPSQGLVVQVTKIEMDGSELVAEASLGTQFYWDSSGFLNVTDAAGVSQAYVDGSLATRDLAIAQNASDIADVSSNLPTDFYSQAYVDGSLNVKADLSQGIQIIANGQYPVYVSSLDALVSYINGLTSPVVGVVVTMPPGNFSTSTPVIFQSGMNITLKGAGLGYTVSFNGGVTFNSFTEMDGVHLIGDTTFNSGIGLRDSLITGNVTHTAGDFNITKVGIVGNYTNSASGKIVALNLEITGDVSLNGTGDQMLMNVQVGGGVSSAGQLIASNLVVQGGDVNCDNGMTSTPNLLNSIYCFTGGITCGTAVTVIGSVYVATSISGSAVSRLNTA